MKKYYFIFYWTRHVSTTSNPSAWKPINSVIDIHPMDWATSNNGENWNGGSSNENVLQSWQEITEEQYKEF